MYSVEQDIEILASGGRVRTGAGEWLFRMPSRHDALLRQGSQELLQHRLRGWEHCHEALGSCAPQWCEFVSPGELACEYIDGVVPLNIFYAKGGGKMPPGLWATFFSKLQNVWELPVPEKESRTVTPDIFWWQHFKVGHVASANRQAWKSALAHPVWFIDYLQFRWRYPSRERYVNAPLKRYPAILTKLWENSRVGTLLGDVMLSNLVTNQKRLVFVDFEHVGAGPVVVDLSILFFDWWLARGMVAGDDDFIAPFVAAWRQYVGEESWLLALIKEWLDRVFPDYFSTYASCSLRREDASVSYGTMGHRILRARRQGVFKETERIVDFVSRAHAIAVGRH